MSLQAVCRAWNRTVAVRAANRARCPECGQRVTVKDFRIEFHRLPGRST